MANPLDILRNIPLPARNMIWNQIRAETPMGQNPTPEIIDSVMASYYLQQQSAQGAAETKDKVRSK